MEEIIMSGVVALTQSERSALLSLQAVQKLSDRTTIRLSTGRKVSSPVDDAVSYFRAQSLRNRSSDLAIRRSDIEQGISNVRTAVDAGSSVDTLLRQLRGIAESARSATQTSRTESTTQFRSVLTQISNIVGDAQFQGLNLLNNTANSLTVNFSTDDNSKLEIAGANLISSARTDQLFTVAGVFGAAGVAANAYFTLLGFSVTTTPSLNGFTQLGANNSNVAVIDTTINRIDGAISNLSAQLQRLGSNGSILETRLTFTNSYINRLDEGADNLVLADLNEEGAYLLALQTRQQLGISALSLAAAQQQSVLALLR